MKILWLILSGILSGVLGGMGMGGGTALIPILTLLLNYTQHEAQWINTVTFIPMSIFALIIHIKNKLVNKKILLMVIIPALVGAIATSYCSTLIRGRLLSILFGAFLIALGIFSIIMTIINGKKRDNLKNQEIKGKVEIE